MVLTLGCLVARKYTNKLTITEISTLKINSLNTNISSQPVIWNQNQRRLGLIKACTKSLPKFYFYQKYNNFTKKKSNFWGCQFWLQWKKIKGRSFRSSSLTRKLILQNLKVNSFWAFGHCNALFQKTHNITTRISVHAHAITYKQTNRRLKKF